MRDVLVTGAAGGLGLAACTRLAAAGWRVFAADLEPPAGAGLVPVRLDVTSDESVAAAVRAVSARSRGLAGLVNFAGIFRVGALLDVEAEALREVLDVNLLGTHRVTRAFFPLVQAGKGRVVVVSSETAVQSGAPFNGLYQISKHAVDAYGDSLRRELMFLGVPVVKLQPGPFQTGMLDSIVPRFEQAAAASVHHGDRLRSLLHRLPAEQAKAHDPALLAEVVEQALTARLWRSAYLVRPDRQRMMLDRLPPRVADAVLRVGVRVMSRRSR